MYISAGKVGSAQFRQAETRK